MILFTAVSAFPGGSPEGRDVQADLKKEAGKPLTEEEREIAGYVLTFYYVRYGHGTENAPFAEAANAMTDEEYANAVRQAVKVSQSGAAKGLLGMGKAGEKLLKAMIATAEDAARATGNWIEKKAREYDEKKK